MKRRGSTECFPALDTKERKRWPYPYPATIHDEVVAKILGIPVSIVKHLVKVGHLPVLGPVEPGEWVKFATAEIFELCDDLEWLRKARVLEKKYWRLKQNSERKAKRLARNNGHFERQQKGEA